MSMPVQLMLILSAVVVLSVIFLGLIMWRRYVHLSRSITALKRSNHELGLLNTLSSHLAACQSKDEIYSVVSRIANRLFSMGSGALYMIEGSQNQAIAACTWGDLIPGVKSFSLDECWALRSGRTFVAGSEEICLRCDHVQEDDGAKSSHFTYLCVPIFIEGELEGVFHQLMMTSRFDPRLEFLATAITDHVMNAFSNLLQREKLHALSIRDSLTGLFNRRYMQDALERELSRCARYNQPVSLLMMDIDHFKDFNDMYGHAAGDNLLKALGEFMCNNLRAEDIACRYGGEEFLIILPNTDLPAGTSVAHKIWQGIRHIWVEHKGQPAGPVTLSIGVSSCPRHGRSAQALIHIADRAMYRAKHLGRDRVEIAGGRETSFQNAEDFVFSTLILQEGTPGN